MERIIVLPCNGDSAPGKITWLATEEMVLAEEAEPCISFRQTREIIELTKNAITTECKTINKIPPLFSGCCCG